MATDAAYTAIDLFSGCGGLTVGLKRAGFKVVHAVEIDPIASQTYALNHPETEISAIDIRKLKTDDIWDSSRKPIHLLAGCPPCQGFSTIRRLNKKSSIRDARNSLVSEFGRWIKELMPLTIMMENVPGIQNYYLFKNLLKEIKKLGYRYDHKVVDICNYGVPQRRKRLVLLASRIGEINIPPNPEKRKSVRDVIEGLDSVESTIDHVHRIYARNSQRIKDMIKLIPADGGSRRDLPDEMILECHKKKGIGFSDVYGRLRWDEPSGTITGGCLNPSKGRFLHPNEHRSITAREASLLQSFPIDYKFLLGTPKEKLALMIGNALPPEFSFHQAQIVFQHLYNTIGK